MSKSTSSSDNAFNDSLNFVKKLWGGMGVPGMNASSMPTMQNMAMPTMSVEELDKRIAELKSVETWLNMNVSMLHNSIQAMEIQRATLATLHSLSSTMSQTMQGTGSEKGDKKKDDPAAASAASPAVSPFLNQSAAWWNAVQDQFKQALDTALTNSTAPAKSSKSATTNAKKPAAKTTAKRAAKTK